MAWSGDARIPLTVLASAEALQAGLDAAPAALLVQAPPSAMPTGAVAQASYDLALAHASACGCCGGRSALALALDRLFQARARGQCPWFTRVLALAETAEVEAALASALRDDSLTVARFRRGP